VGGGSSVGGGAAGGGGASAGDGGFCDVVAPLMATVCGDIAQCPNAPYDPPCPFNLSHCESGVSQCSAGALQTLQKIVACDAQALPMCMSAADRPKVDAVYQNCADDGGTIDATCDLAVFGM
jgi:hypothetical protein